jgi:hypothetical protein
LGESEDSREEPGDAEGETSPWRHRFSLRLIVDNAFFERPLAYLERCGSQ